MFFKQQLLKSSGLKLHEQLCSISVRGNLLETYLFFCLEIRGGLKCGSDSKKIDDVFFL